MENLKAKLEWYIRYSPGSEFNGRIADKMFDELRKSEEGYERPEPIKTVVFNPPSGQTSILSSTQPRVMRYPRASRTITIGLATAAAASLIMLGTHYGPTIAGRSQGILHWLKDDESGYSMMVTPSMTSAAATDEPTTYKDPQSIPAQYAHLAYYTDIPSMTFRDFTILDNSEYVKFMENYYIPGTDYYLRFEVKEFYTDLNLYSNDKANQKYLITYEIDSVQVQAYNFVGEDETVYYHYFAINDRPYIISGNLEPEFIESQVADFIHRMLEE